MPRKIYINGRSTSIARGIPVLFEQTRQNVIREAKLLEENKYAQREYIAFMVERGGSLDECCVCYDKTLMLPKCGHATCITCIDMLTKQNKGRSPVMCPLCRKDVEINLFEVCGF